MDVKLFSFKTIFKVTNPALTFFSVLMIRLPIKESFVFSDTIFEKKN